MNYNFMKKYDNKKIKIISEHVPVNVSVFSNFPDFDI